MILTAIPWLSNKLAIWLPNWPPPIMSTVMVEIERNCGMLNMVQQ